MLLGSFKGDSRISINVEKTINNKMMLSKCSCPTIVTENFLTQFSGVISHNDLPVTVRAFLFGFSAASTSLYLIALIEKRTDYVIFFSLASKVFYFKNFFWFFGDLIAS